MIEKATAGDFLGRFREIISDPLNLLIRRVPHAGQIVDNFVYLHNGLTVPISGPHSYYDAFSEILSINRGVHEPLEEYVFQRLLDSLPQAPIMLELGAYWGHYSMWLKSMRPHSTVYLVESEPSNLASGMANFRSNGLKGEFIQDFVGKETFRVDNFLSRMNLDHLDILHADIQGYEVEMLDCCVDLLASARIDFVFISTHSQDLHENTIQLLQAANYRIEVTADFDNERTAGIDGLANDRQHQQC